MKTCRNCKVEKELTEFHKRKQSADGLDCNCRTCSNERRDFQRDKRNKKNIYLKRKVA